MDIYNQLVNYLIQVWLLISLFCRGTFEILELGGSDVFWGIQAYFPCVVNPKIDEIAKDLLEKLKFRVSTRKSVWPRIFQLDPPTKEDIGLYFFSCDLGR